MQQAWARQQHIMGDSMRSSIVKWQGSSKTLLALGLVGTIAFGSTSCLKSKDKKDEPTSESVNAAGLLKRASIRVKLPEASGLDLRAEAERVRVQVLKSKDGKKSESDSEPYTFPIAADELYVLSDVSGGAVFISVDLLGSDDNPIASGELETELSADSVPEVQVQIAALPLDLGLILTPAAATETEQPAPAPVSEPAAVKAVLKSGNCLGCHSTRAKLGGLVLDTFPYSSTNAELTAGGNAAIMTRVVERVTSTDAPMPPSGPALKADAVSTLEDFRDALAAPAPSSNPPSFAVQLVKMTIYLDAAKTVDTELVAASANRFIPKAKIDVLPGNSYTYDLTVFGQDATVLAEVKKGSFEVPLSGEVELSLSFDASGTRLNQPALDIAPPASY